MPNILVSAMALLIAASLSTAAQSAAGKSIVGTVTGFQAESGEIQVRPDSAAPVFVRISPDTLVQRVAPGEKDLKKAETIQITDLNIDDRVLVSFVAGMEPARRIVVMPASEIARQKEAERRDWQQRGASGVVVSVKGNDITLRSHSMAGEITTVITVSEQTRFRRYKPDSVRFADATESRLGEVKPGDQLRGRGEKSAEGGKLTAEDVVFGSFLTKAGAIESIDAAQGEITVKELDSKKTFTVKVTPDSQVKRWPNLPAGLGAGRAGMGFGGGRPAGAPSGTPGAPAAGAPAGAGGMRRPGGAPDLAQMLERMPTTALTDLKAGEQIVVSSTRGNDARHLTAIMLLANAESLIQMASAQQQRSAQGGLSVSGGGMNMNSMLGSSGGLELPTMMP